MIIYGYWFTLVRQSCMQITIRYYGISLVCNTLIEFALNKRLRNRKKHPFVISERDTSNRIDLKNLRSLLGK